MSKIRPIGAGTAGDNPPPGTATGTRIADLVCGMRVAGVFVVKKLVRRAQPSGAPFLLFQFADRSGSMNGVLWDQTVVATTALSVGDLAHIEGDVQTYQNARQIRVRKLERADPFSFDVSEFLPQSPCDIDALWQRVLQRIDAVGDPFLRRLYQDLFHAADFAARYRCAPAGKGWHHAYVGGLLEHAVSMLELGEVLERQHPALDPDLLVGGILLHDVGMIEELMWRSHIDYTPAGRLVGHLVQGCLLVARAMDRIEGFPDEQRNRLLHILVSHHGALERGSPKPPMTLEAVVVHLLDHLDSQAHGVEQVLERGVGADGWTEHVKLLDRFFYAGRSEVRGAGPDDAPREA